MREDTTEIKDAEVEVIVYSDDVNNLKITNPETGESAKVHIEEQEVAEVCEALGVEVPVAGARPPERWG